MSEINDLYCIAQCRSIKIILFSHQIINSLCILVCAKEQPVYEGGRYDLNIYFLKYCCLVKQGCCLKRVRVVNPNPNSYPNHHGH